MSIMFFEINDTQNNRKKLEQCTFARCGYCLELLLVSEIVQWTDNEQTAICPVCHVDAVLPNAQRREAKDYNKHYFLKPNAHKN